MILPPKTGNASILIQKHKTKRVNGDIKFTFDDKVTKLIRNYVKMCKIKYDDKQFGDLKKTCRILQAMQSTTKWMVVRGC